MKITRNNYETFLIDYLDGKLNATEREAVRVFLDENPDIREEFEGLENISLETPPILFPGKSLLKKTEIKTIAGIGENNYKNYFIAFYEDDLTVKQQNDLQIFLAANPRLKPEFKLHKSLLLEKAEHLIYPHKEELKRKPAIGIWWLAGSGVAATVALFFAWFNLFQSDGVNRPPNPMTLVQLAPKPVAGISTVVLPSIITARKKPLAQKEIETAETLTYETVNISKLNNKELSVNLNEETNYTTLVLEFRNSGILAASANKMNGKAQKRGVVGRVVKHNLKLLAERIPKRNKKKSADPTFVKILDGGISAFNTVTGSEIEMTKVYAKDGRLTSYQIETETLNISRSIPESGNGQ